MSKKGVSKKGVNLYTYMRKNTVMFLLFIHLGIVCTKRLNKINRVFFNGFLKVQKT